MEGRKGYMPIGDFESLVMRNAYRPNLRMIHTRWGKVNGAPDFTCTLVKGDPGNGDAFNVPFPDIPEQSEIDEKTGHIIARGWRTLLIWLVSERTIRPSHEVLEVMGYRDYERATKRLGCV